MTAFVSKTNWKKRFKGYNIIDVSLRNDYMVSLILKERVTVEKSSRMTDWEYNIRLVCLYLDDSNENTNNGLSEGTGFSLPTASASRIPNMPEQDLISNSNIEGEVIPAGCGRAWDKEFIAQITGHDHIYIERLKCINGYPYAVAGASARRIYKRIGEKKWIVFANEFKGPEATWPGYNKLSNSKQTSLRGTIGFDDIDGFSDDDMYAVGGCGDVWQYNGKEWSQCAFPSNEQTNRVCCAGDGQVYIGGEGCSLWRGRGNSWVKVYKNQASILWNDIIWFNDELWLSSGYHFKKFRDGKLIEVEQDGKSIFMSGHMDAYKNILVIASTETVMLYDGKRWQEIVIPYFDD